MRTRYGFRWGPPTGDAPAFLLDRCGEHPDSLTIVAGHISSDQTWAEHDIRVFHHEREPGPAEFAWLGTFDSEDALDAACPRHICTKEEHGDG